jgi:CubicO group peptidase (beta-lactamase class C family)
MHGGKRKTANSGFETTPRARFSLPALFFKPLAAVAVLAAVLTNAHADDRAWPGYGALLEGNVLPDVEVAMLSHTDRLFPVNVVYRGGPVRPLASGPAKLGNVHFQSGGKDYDLFDYLATNRIAGLLVLKDGKIAFEDYELGIDSGTRWASFSMAKSLTSTLVGAALKQGLIRSLDDPVTDYVPALKGGAYDSVSVRNVLQMASGVKWNETYTDPNSDLRKLAALRQEGKPGAALAYMKDRPRAATPGTLWNYNTGETFILGAVLEGATHQPAATFLSKVIWARLGMEQDATWWIESPGGMAYGGAGIGATLRDYGRFGLLVQNDGAIDGERIVPDAWFQEAGSAHIIGGKKIKYGYQWWTMQSDDPVHEGAFEASGIFGQHLYVNPRERIVIAVFSARPKPSRVFRMLDDDAFFGAVIKALQ